MKVKKYELINFIDLNEKNILMVLNWRNNNNIKKWMYTNDEIPLSKHIEFISKLKTSKDKIYYLVKKEDNYIGVIYFSNIKINDSLIMGIYTNPFLKGYGRSLLELIIDYSFDKLKVKKVFAEVFIENIKACDLYKSFGFKKINEKKVNEKTVLCLELENENR